MSNLGNEIITFQFGHYSNHIGTHWWNCQEAGFEYDSDLPSEINHDVMFREGQTSRGETTFTPRLMLVDLKGSLGTLPEVGKLYHSPPIPEASLPLWPSDRVAIESQQSQQKNEFLQDLESGETLAATLPDGFKKKGQAVPKIYHLADSVNTWSDFLRPHLHPRSINIVQEYQHNDQSLPFDSFPQGITQWSSSRFNEKFTDRIRLYMEETNNLQGFQILMDNFDGFSGLGCGCLQYLKDEFPSKATFCVASQPPVLESTPKKDSVRLLNQALAISSLAEHRCLFTPVSGTTEAWRQTGSPVQLPHISYKQELHYHSSAIVASALDTISLLYRLSSPSERLSDLCTRFAMCNRLATALSLSLPFPMTPRATLLDTLEAWDGPLSCSLTPQANVYSDQWMQTFVLRGVPESKLMRADQLNLSSSNPAYSCRTLAQLLKTYLTFDGQNQGVNQVVTANSTLKTSAPFPHIFSKNVSFDGQLEEEPRPEYLSVDRVPVLAGLHSSQSLGPLLEKLHSEAKRVNIRSLHQFTDAGLESTELLESLEQLLCLSECYSSNHMDL